MRNLAIFGRYFFALAAVGSGIQQLVRADFVRLVTKLPDWIPQHVLLAYVVGVLLIVAGASILSNHWARWGAMVLGFLLLLLFLGQSVPQIISNPLTGFMWTNPAKVLAFFGGALVVMATPPAGAGREVNKWESLLPLGPILLGIFFFICGFQHFYYADFVDTLVPHWLPFPRFWTCFTGTCLMAGGLGLVIPATMRWAALLSGVMVFLWVFMLHIPRAVTMPDPGETSAIFEALAISGVAFMVTGLRLAGRAAPPEREFPAAPALEENRGV